MPAGGEVGTGPASRAEADYRSFLVRVWRTDDGTRATVQDVVTQATRTFPSLPALCAWLGNVLGDPPDHPARSDAS